MVRCQRTVHGDDESEDGEQCLNFLHRRCQIDCMEFLDEFNFVVTGEEREKVEQFKKLNLCADHIAHDKKVLTDLLLGTDPNTWVSHG